MRVLKHYGNGWRPPKKVMNVDTGVIFDSFAEAAESLGVKKSSGICIAISRSGTYKGYHWKKINA